MDISVNPEALSVDDDDLALIEALCHGLPLDPRPYQVLGGRLGMSEPDVIAALERLIDQGVIRRFGVVVHHRRLGYTANAMVVWDIADDRVDEMGQLLGKNDCVTLCYRRPRRLPEWPYNLFSMVHGGERETVCAQVAQLAKDLAAALGVDAVAHDVLFSRRQFKQRGAHYGNGASSASGAKGSKP